MNERCCGNGPRPSTLSTSLSSPAVSSSGALVTDARLSQLFDPIARLADEPSQYHHNHYSSATTSPRPSTRVAVGSGNGSNQHSLSNEYAHLTAYPAIIEPASSSYDDGSSRYCTKYTFLFNRITFGYLKLVSANAVTTLNHDKSRIR